MATEYLELEVPLEARKQLNDDLRSLKDKTSETFDPTQHVVLARKIVGETQGIKPSRSPRIKAYSFRDVTLSKVNHFLSRRRSTLVIESGVGEAASKYGPVPHRVLVTFDRNTLDIEQIERIDFNLRNYKSNKTVLWQRPIIKT